MLQAPEALSAARVDVEPSSTAHVALNARRSRSFEWLLSRSAVRAVVNCSGFCYRKMVWGATGDAGPCGRPQAFLDIVGVEELPLASSSERALFRAAVTLSGVASMLT
jgi:hypothetical protein